MKARNLPVSMLCADKNSFWKIIFILNKIYCNIYHN